MIPKRFRPFDPTKGPWLIWSYYHSAWHRRSSTGSAAGYTTDIAHAGVFGVKVARAYHDTGPKAYRRDVAIPARKAAAALDHRLSEMGAERERLAQTIASLRTLPADHDASVLSPQGSDSAPAPDET